MIKYFSNNQYANTCFHQNANACKLIMSREFQQNSFTNTLVSYLKAWPILKNVSEDKKYTKFSRKYFIKMECRGLFRAIETSLYSLDNMQSENSTIGEVKHIFEVFFSF